MLKHGNMGNNMLHILLLLRCYKKNHNTYIESYLHMFFLIPMVAIFNSMHWFPGNPVRESILLQIKWDTEAAAAVLFVQISSLHNIYSHLWAMLPGKVLVVCWTGKNGKQILEF